MVEKVIFQLRTKGLIEPPEETGEQVIYLTNEGKRFVGERSGTASRIREQFEASLLARACHLVADQHSGAAEIAAAATQFFQDCIEQRALGVAMWLSATDERPRAYQMVALLQSLPLYFGVLADEGAARALVKLVQGVLARPSEAEAKYCGLLLQGRFGLHVLGLDHNTIKARIRELRDTVFLLDSTSMIPLLATSCVGNRPATEMVKRMRQLGARVVATPNFVHEVREHVNYAWRVIEKAGGEISDGVLGQLLGERGGQSNAFLEGFAQQLADGSTGVASYKLYMGSMCGLNKVPITTPDTTRVLGGRGVDTRRVNEWIGFDQVHFAEVEELSQQIADRRRQSGTYRHERQVRAEAEALVIIRYLREGRYTLEENSVKNAFFVSNSRFIDELSHTGLPVTMRQTAVLQWLGTTVPLEEHELPLLMDSLLWELSERGFAIVDSTRLRLAFSGMISAAKEEYPKIADQHRTLIATQWGVNSEYAFQTAPDELSYSALVRRHALQTVDRQVAELKRARAVAQEAQRFQQLSEADRHQLNRLKEEKQARLRNRRRKARGHQSNPKKKRR